MVVDDTVQSMRLEVFLQVRSVSLSVGEKGEQIRNARFSKKRAELLNGLRREEDLEKGRNEVDGDVYSMVESLVWAMTHPSIDCTCHP